MTIAYKSIKIETNINERDIDLHNIDAHFYSEDKKTALIIIRLNKEVTKDYRKDLIPIDLNKEEMEPQLDIFTEDESVFLNEAIEIIDAETGLIQYTVSNNVLRHIGKVQAKLFLRNSNKSLHVANFNFDIRDSGISDKVSKEVHIDNLEQIIERVLNNKIEDFRGEKGEKGDTGDTLLASPKIYSRDEYNRLETKDNNTLYFISEV